MHGTVGPARIPGPAFFTGRGEFHTPGGQRADRHPVAVRDPARAVDVREQQRAAHCARTGKYTSDMQRSAVPEGMPRTNSHLAAARGA